MRLVPIGARHRQKPPIPTRVVREAPQVVCRADDHAAAQERGRVAPGGQADVVVRPAAELLDRLHFGLGRACHLRGVDQHHPLPRFGRGLLVVVEGEPVRKPPRPLRLAGQQPRPGRGRPDPLGPDQEPPSRRASSPGGRCGGPRPSARTSRPSARELRRTRPETGRSRHPPSGPPRHPQRPGPRHRDVGGTLRGSTHTEAQRQRPGRDTSEVREAVLHALNDAVWYPRGFSFARVSRTSDRGADRWGSTRSVCWTRPASASDSRLTEDRPRRTAPVDALYIPRSPLAPYQLDHRKPSVAAGCLLSEQVPI